MEGGLAKRTQWTGRGIPVCCSVYRLLAAFALRKADLIYFDLRSFRGNKRLISVFLARCYSQ